MTERNGQLERGNRELTRVNEELQAANEEAQAATEEVETLNEELQATNEELETLNEELQATIEELNTTSDDQRDVAIASSVAGLDETLEPGSYCAPRYRIINVMVIDCPWCCLGPGIWASPSMPRARERTPAEARRSSFTHPLWWSAGPPPRRRSGGSQR